MKNIYFVGIGGIGMSALARFFVHEGYSVAGYDRISTPLTEKLENEGIAIHYSDSVALIPVEFRDPTTTRVIFTPAVKEDHTELTFFRANNFEIIKRAKALGVLCQNKYTMAVAGTHGKSTTSTLVAWINHCASTDGTGSAFLGAISKNFGSNIVMGTGDRMAVEADEFDRSFHQLHPAVALVTSADADHLDIYGTAENVREAFRIFISQVKYCTIIKYGLDLPHTLTYSLDDPRADFHALNITLRDGGYYNFDLNLQGHIIKNCTLGIPGLVNIENAVGAVALTYQKGFDENKIQEALATYRGVERRFDFWINEPSKVYLDDYAHHPRELTAMLRSVRKMFPHRHITICFQPHLYTRTRDFADEFSQALTLADRVILIPIYPARELPIAGVDSKMIYDHITCEKFLCEKAELVSMLAQMDHDIVITAGAGDIDTLRQQIAQVIGRPTDA
ncbi:MAG: UDP-N-acetylmuramate--L-alanine ligase [Mucinivorans sp.]